MEEPKEEDLQLAQRILDLTKILEENTERMNLLSKELNEVKTQQEKWIKNLEEWDINLDKRFREIDNRFTESNNKYSNDIELIRGELKESKEETEAQINSFAKDFTMQIETKAPLESLKEHKDKYSHDFENLNSRISSMKEEIDTQISSMKEEIDTQISSTELNLKNEIKDSSEKLHNEITSFNDKISEELELISETLEMLVKNVKSVNKLTENHTETLENHRNSLTLTKQKINEIVEQTKKNQEQLFENFSRILESYNEDIRTEIAITAQSLQESDTELLKQSREEFMSKKLGNELKNTIMDLSAELHAESQKTRDDLLKGLQDNVDEYKKVINEQNINIKRFQDELGDFKNEIHAIIDRKVNEKYELVYKLLAKVSSLSEEIALLIKVSEIILPPQAKHLSKIVSQDESIQDIVSEKSPSEEKNNTKQ